MLTYIFFHISGRPASAGVPGTALALALTITMVWVGSTKGSLTPA